MSPDTPDKSERLWWLLLGAMIASPEIRASSRSKISGEDVPREVAELWQFVTGGDGNGVRAIMRGMGLEVSRDGVMSSMVRHLQEKAMGELCQRLMTRAELTRLQSPEQLRDKFIKMASLLESRIAIRDSMRDAAQADQPGAKQNSS